MVRLIDFSIVSFHMPYICIMRAFPNAVLQLQLVRLSRERAFIIDVINDNIFMSVPLSLRMLSRFIRRTACKSFTRRNFSIIFFCSRLHVRRYSDNIFCVDALHSLHSYSWRIVRLKHTKTIKQHLFVYVFFCSHSTANKSFIINLILLLLLLKAKLLAECGWKSELGHVLYISTVHDVYCTVLYITPYIHTLYALYACRVVLSAVLSLTQRSKYLILIRKFNYTSSRLV